MKLFQILFLLTLSKAFCENIFKLPVTKSQEFYSFSNGLKEVVQEFYIKNEIQFDIVVINDRIKNQFELDFLIKNYGTFAHRLSSIPNKLNGIFVTTNSAVILASSCADLNFINSKIFLANQFTKSFRFLIYIQNCKLNKLQNYIEYLVVKKQLTFKKGLIENYEFLLINDGHFLKLTTIEWFTESACNHPQLVILNTFNKLTQKWSKKLKIYEKFQDFHGCNLTLWVAPDIKPSLFADIIMEKDNHKGRVVGLIPQIFIDLSQKYNFVPKFQMFEEEAGRLADVCFSVYRPSSGLDDMHFTAPFMEIQDIILATPGELYTPYEKLWLPFDDLTWKFLIVVFFVAFIAIFVINQSSKLVQDEIYGVNIQKPALNVISAFFGIAQHKVPKKSFPRCLLIIFVFFCLIFRTCYQSKMYEFMTTEPRRPPPRSVRELTDRNFTLYTTLKPKDIYELTRDDKNEWPLIKQLSYLELRYKLTTQSHNASAKISIIIQSNTYNYFQSINGLFLKWHQLKNVNFQVNQIIDKETQRLTAAGIIDYLIVELTRGKHVYESKEKWKILTLEKLRFGFVIWLCSCAGTVIVFLMESFFWISKWKIKRSLFTVSRYKCNKHSKVYPIQDRNNNVEREDKNEQDLLIRKHELWLKTAFKVATIQQKGDKKENRQDCKQIIWENQILNEISR
ncbi:hypothetical protein ACKWTF_015112 [Chironomus riparius]